MCSFGNQSAVVRQWSGNASFGNALPSFGSRSAIGNFVAAPLRGGPLAVRQHTGNHNRPSRTVTRCAQVRTRGDLPSDGLAQVVVKEMN
jgi:hypothetical protein